jgi:bacterioferritin-associated ferredoxin
MGAGAADLLMRSSGVLPSAPVVLAGNGPLLLLVAASLIAAGVETAALLDIGSMTGRLRALPLIPASLLDISYIGKGLRMAFEILKKKIPLVRTELILAEGRNRVEAVVCRSRDGEQRIACATLLVHGGFIPRTHFSRLLRCEHIWHSGQRCWLPDCTDYGAARKISGLYFTGDGLRVDGADAARLKGGLTGIAAALSLGAIDKREAEERATPIRRQLRRLLFAHAYLDALFRPNPAMYGVPDDTLLCRCEHVTAGEVREAVREGYLDSNDLKTRSRAGMGQCQGRMCEQAVAEVAAATVCANPIRMGMLSVRPPLRPLSLQEFCEFEQ